MRSRAVACHSPGSLAPRVTGLQVRQPACTGLRRRPRAGTRRQPPGRGVRLGGTGGRGQGPVGGQVIPELLVRNPAELLGLPESHRRRFPYARPRAAATWSSCPRHPDRPGASPAPPSAGVAATSGASSWRPPCRARCPVTRDPGSSSAIRGSVKSITVLGPVPSATGAPPADRPGLADRAGLAGRTGPPDEGGEVLLWLAGWPAPAARPGLGPWARRIHRARGPRHCVPGRPRPGNCPGAC